MSDGADANDADAGGPVGPAGPVDGLAHPDRLAQWLDNHLLDAAAAAEREAHREADRDTDRGGRPEAAGEDDTALIARLETDADAVALLAERAALHAALRRSVARSRLGRWATARAAESASPVTVARPGGPRARAIAAGVAAAACLAMLLVGAGQAWRGTRAAVVTRVVGAARSAGGPLGVGDSVGRSPVDLEVGLLALRTRRGVEVVIEAPAAFRFESPQRLRMLRGRMSADVPQGGRGFTVVTPSGEAVDLGTRFAVDVLPSGDSEVHVFDGEVVTRGAAATRPRSLRDGEAVVVAANEPREFRTAAFIRGDEVAGIAAAVAAGREARAAAAAERLRGDPALVAIVDFEQVAPAVGGDAAGSGQFRMLQGRWPGSHAAEFSAVGDHFPVDVGGDEEWPRLTLAAWVRIDRLGQPYQSLYHTDGWQADRPGQVHWMITRDCVMRLALRQMRLADGATEKHGFPDSRTPVVGARGRWMHLATVYDSEARTTRFYVDGRFDGETRLAEAPPARLGAARIGNWNRDDRRLSGRIDELVILGRALGDDEIVALHAAGSPYGDGRP